MNRLSALVMRFLSGEISVEAFYSAYEHIYNFGTDPAALTGEEARVFETLFDVVARYSPFEDEREAISFYCDEKQIREVALTAVEALGLNTPGRRE
ncbi:colicin immunity domain-containing protein [Sphingopyxis granuli]|uniref:colicin immunity domain-containing protein n=1 Tax=Sphingopyxis granuli TaxID=267128 RepID=UPI001BAF5DE6|nr:colicin immunity domain-containing protein [Sphingopyxis granuli]QUM73226.1 hypothetical protein ICN83_04835 [Sphingopyxis granuli]